MSRSNSDIGYVSLRRPEPGGGDVGEGLHLGIAKIATARNKNESPRAHLTFKIRRVSNIPFACVRLMWLKSKGCFGFPTKLNNADAGSQKIGAVATAAGPVAAYFTTEEWPEPATSFTDDSEYVWVPTVEIVNNRHVYGFDICRECIKFFEDNKEACFVFDDSGIPFANPAVVYNGAHKNEIASAIGLGKTRASPFSSHGPYYYFGSFNYAMYFATSYVEDGSRKVGNVVLTRNKPKGVYKEGGIARYAIAEGKVSIRPTDEWAKQFDSLIMPKRDGWDASYIVSNYENQTPLDYADVNTSKMKSKKDIARARVVTTFDTQR